MHPGITVRKLRAERGWSLEELAAKAGIHKMNLSKLERGLVDPRIGTLQKIAAALELPVTALVPDAVTSPDQPVRDDAPSKEGADVERVARQRMRLETLEVVLVEALETVRRGLAEYAETRDPKRKSG